MQIMMSVNKYRYQILAVLAITIVLALLLMPSLVVEAGRAISNGG